MSSSEGQNERPRAPACLKAADDKGSQHGPRTPTLAESVCLLWPVVSSRAEWLGGGLTSGHVGSIVAVGGHPGSGSRPVGRVASAPDPGSVSAG
jgi:hypothetical protein